MAIHKNIKLLAWLNFFTDFKLYSAVLAIYFAKATGSYALGMSIFSIAMLSSAILEVPTGIFSDRIGRRKTIIFGSASSILYAIFYAIGGAYWVFVVGAIFEGLSRALYSGNNSALLYDTLAETKQEKEYHEFLGKTSSMFQVALAISAVLGGIIAHWSFALVMWISVIPQILGFLISFQFIEPSIHVGISGNVFIHTKKALMHFFKNKKLRLLTLASVIGHSLAESAFQFRSVFINTLWPLWAVGIAQMLSNVGATISFYFSGKLIKRFGELKLLVIGNIYSRIVNIVALIFPTPISPAMMSSTSLFFGSTSVAKNTLAQKEFAKGQRATMGSLTSLLKSIVFATTAFLVGLFADKIGPAKALLIMQIALFSVIWLYWKLFKKEKDNL